MPTPFRERAGGVALAGLCAVASLAAFARLWLPLSAPFLVRACAWFAIVAVPAVVNLTGSNHPFPVFGPANRTTMARLVFVALVGGAIGEPAQPMIAASAAAAAMAVTMMDSVDGWLARRSRMSSAFGARFDMEVDALLILALSILAFTHDKAGVWVIASGLLRYLFVAAGWLWPWMERSLMPSHRRQAVCVIQIVALIAVVEPMVVRPISTAVAAAALALLGASFFVDTLWLVLHRREQVA
jgi:phosphatidylglycerophosphate synthase